jgi:hypothetical protein
MHHRPRPTVDLTVVERVRSELREVRRDALATEMQLIQEALPEVWADAERLVIATHHMPWEVGAAFLDGELGAIQDKYEVPIMRRRPGSDTVGPLTDIFCDPCELVAEREQRRREQTAAR